MTFPPSFGSIKANVTVICMHISADFAVVQIRIGGKAMEKNEKSALITGASRGIGKAIAKQFAREGYRLYLVCHKNKDMLEQYAISLEETFAVSVTCFCGDISDSSFVNTIFQNISRLDVLINNAGISHVGLLQDMTDDQWHHLIQTNLDSCFFTSRQAIPLMLKSGSGSILNISSVWGVYGASMEVAYSASKGGVNAFTRALAKELAPSGISVNAIACGLIDTEMNAHLSAEEMNRLFEEIPAGRSGKPEEVAQLSYQIATGSSYLTGQIVSLDGGWF